MRFSLCIVNGNDFDDNNLFYKINVFYTCISKIMFIFVRRYYIWSENEIIDMYSAITEKVIYNSSSFVSILM